MNEIPGWLATTWVVVSLLFFILNIVLFGVLIFVALKLKSQAEAMQPKLDELLKKANETVVQVQEIAKKVQEIANNVGTTANDVGTRAKGIVGSAELMTQSASRQFERFSPLVVGAVTGIRLIRALNDIRGGRKPKDAVTGKNMKRPPKRKGILSLFGRR
jgi:low affinity Fe/Cu permease